jgi:NAD(P)-dependent dehydrogenase (short-subunit alcohol dehydrogenase family)
VNPTHDFTGEVALITGASSAMGLATARAFAQAGAAVVLSDINEDTFRTGMDDLTTAATPHADHSNPRHPLQRPPQGSCSAEHHSGRRANIEDPERS